MVFQDNDLTIIFAYLIIRIFQVVIYVKVHFIRLTI